MWLFFRLNPFDLKMNFWPWNSPILGQLLNFLKYILDHILLAWLTMQQLIIKFWDPEALQKRVGVFYRPRNEPPQYCQYPCQFMNFSYCHQSLHVNDFFDLLWACFYIQGANHECNQETCHERLQMFTFLIQSLCFLLSISKWSPKS